MLFCSYTYFLFLAVGLLALRATEGWSRSQGVLLIVLSNVFYGYWDPRFLVLIWISTLLDFTVGICLEKVVTERRRKGLVCLSVAGNLGMLGFFKYFDFFQSGAARLLESLGIPYDPWLLGIILPVGISFYTFQTMSYSIDVYRRIVPPCKDLFHFARYVMFFPQLVAGPIERASHLLPQLKGPWHVRLPNVMSGSLLIVWGVFKKAVIGDTAGLYIVDPVFANPEGGLHLWMAVFAFGIQIYADFSGYCDIARGTARCMGVELVDNFNAPYWSSNVAEFWRRWHVSLSEWFRDYVYVPLGGNRMGRLHTLFNLWVTMTLCGLWHGAKLTFVLWGTYHAILLITYRLAEFYRKINRPKRLRQVIGAVYTFALVTYGWLIFRIEEAAMIPKYSMLLLNPFSGSSTPLYWSNARNMGVTLIVLSVPVMVAHWLQIRSRAFDDEIEDVFHRVPYFLGFAYGIMIVITVLFGTLGEDLPFIYFQF